MHYEKEQNLPQEVHSEQQRQLFSDGINLLCTVIPILRADLWPLPSAVNECHCINSHWLVDSMGDCCVPSHH